MPAVFAAIGVLLRLGALLNTKVSLASPRSPQLRSRHDGGLREGFTLPYCGKLRWLNSPLNTRLGNMRTSSTTAFSP